MEKTIISYEDLQKKCVLLAEKIAKNFKPDVVVSMTRGGLLSAYFIADLLGVKSIESINIINNKDQSLTDNATCYKDFSNFKVLIVDDLIDSGHALHYMFDHYKFDLENTKIGVIYYKKDSSIKPDFFLESIVDDQWIVFPYERGKSPTE